MTIAVKTLIKYFITLQVGGILGAYINDAINQISHKKNIKTDETAGTFIVSHGDYVEKNGKLAEKMDVTFVPNGETYHKMIDKAIDNGTVNANVNIKYVETADVNRKVHVDVDTDKVA